MVSVSSWAHRALRGLSRYHHCRDEPEYCQRFASWAPEAVVGVYENPPSAPPSTIVITEKGLYWPSAGGLECLEFASLRDVRGPDEKTGAVELELDLLDGSSRALRIEGGDGKYRDVYSVVRFLARVIEVGRKER
jgi:hypothetical protein